MPLRATACSLYSKKSVVFQYFMTCGNLYRSQKYIRYVNVSTRANLKVYHSKIGSLDLGKFPQHQHLQHFTFIKHIFRLTCGTIVSLHSVDIKLKILATSATRTNSLFHRLPITLQYQHHFRGRAIV